MRCFVSFLFLLLALNTFAANQSVRVEAKGKTIDAAINAGLEKAIAQVNGVSITSVKQQHQSSTMTESASQFNNEQDANTTFVSAGLIESYQVLSKRCQQQCSVELMVKVRVDRDHQRRQQLKDLNANRYTIAVGNFSGRYGDYFIRELEKRLSQDRKFKLLESANDPNVDFVIEGIVQQAVSEEIVQDTRKIIELTGEQVGTYRSDVESSLVVSFNIIDRVNRQIKWSDDIRYLSHNANLSTLLAAAPEAIFQVLKGNIYPLRLISSNGQWILNSGGISIKQGGQYEVYKLGNLIKDPITKESLGRVESLVGMVKVTKTNSKISYVVQTKGVPFSEHDRFIVRPVVEPLNTIEQPKATPASPSKTREKQTSGIILPPIR